MVAWVVAIDVATLLHNRCGTITENEKKKIYMELEPWSQGSNLDFFLLLFGINFFYIVC